MLCLKIYDSAHGTCSWDQSTVISPRHKNIILTIKKEFTIILTEEKVIDSHSEMEPVSVRFNYWKPIKTQTVKGKNNNIGNFTPENSRLSIVILHICRAKTWQKGSGISF